MNFRPDLFDRSHLRLEPLKARQHDLDINAISPLISHSPRHSALETVASVIASAKAGKSAVVLMMGAHVLRAGVQRYLIDMLEKGMLSCIAVNGAGVIHDYEMSLLGGTTESVARYICKGQFGLWQETGRINDIVKKAAHDNLGLGYAVGQIIEERNFPHKDISILAAGYRLNIPITVHVGIGYDIIHEHPNCDGAAFGATSYTDFLCFTQILTALEGGIVMNFGSAVMGPEVYLKALAMVRNVAAQENRKINQFTTLVCDLKPLPDNYCNEADRDDPSYYFRPWKTMLVRTVADGGQSFYVQAHHAETIPELWTALCTKGDL